MSTYVGIAVVATPGLSSWLLGRALGGSWLPTGGSR